MRDATPRLRQAVTRLLEHEVGGGDATSEDLAAASGRLLDRLSQRLTQIIGPAGVEAILLRAVEMRRIEFPFLGDPLEPRSNNESAGEALRARLRELDPDVIRDASVILVATFAGVLATVIGERLAWSLLRDLWPDTLRLDVEPQEADE